MGRNSEASEDLGECLRKLEVGQKELARTAQMDLKEMEHQASPGWDQLERSQKRKKKKETGFLTIMDQKQPTVSNQMHKREWKANGISKKDAEGRGKSGEDGHQFSFLAELMGVYFKEQGLV